MLLSNLWVGAGLGFFFGAVSASRFSPRAWLSEQLRLDPMESDTTLSHNYSVGISLQSSYVAGAVVIRDTQGKVVDTFTKVIPGSWTYDAVMARLSLDSSRHLAPPYEDENEYWTDLPRQLKRRGQKRLGLPASLDVGVLAHPVVNLKKALEESLRIKITSATLTVAHLVALYQDDAADICEFVGIECIQTKDQFRPLFWETAAAYIGYGFGLCEHYRNSTTCHRERLELPDLSVLSVHYSETALTVALARLQWATSLWEPDYRHRERFDLGSRAISAHGSAEEYWREVDEAILQLPRHWPGPDMAILTGNQVEADPFVERLNETLKAFLGHSPPVFIDRPATVAAKGAAELHWRAISS